MGTGVPGLGNRSTSVRDEVSGNRTAFSIASLPADVRPSTLYTQGMSDRSPDAGPCRSVRSGDAASQAARNPHG
ncbi:hypothetical protein DYJ25_05625 [Prevotella denticola]|nr:hypothetical protein DYJ25_05625 [Prevotella denticola]